MRTRDANWELEVTKKRWRNESPLGKTRKREVFFRLGEP